MIHCRHDACFPADVGSVRDFSFDRAILKNSFVSRRGKHPVTVDVLLVAHYRAKICHPVSNGCSLRIRKDFIDLQIECHISRSWFEHAKTANRITFLNYSYLLTVWSAMYESRKRAWILIRPDLFRIHRGEGEHFDSNLVHRVLSSKRITFPFPTIDTIASFRGDLVDNRQTKLTFLVLIIRDARRKETKLLASFSFAVKNSPSKVFPSTFPFFLNVRISTVSMFCSIVARYRCDDSCENGV